MGKSDVRTVGFGGVCDVGLVRKSEFNSVFSIIAKSGFWSGSASCEEGSWFSAFLEFRSEGPMFVVRASTRWKMVAIEVISLKVNDIREGFRYDYVEWSCVVAVYK